MTGGMNPIHRKRKGSPWTPDEDAKVLRLRKEGMTFRQIAPLLDRTATSIETRHRILSNKPV